MPPKELERLVDKMLREGNRLFMQSVPRSGSTMLQTALHSHPKLRMHGEIFSAASQGRGGYNSWPLKRRLRVVWGQRLSGFKNTDAIVGRDEPLHPEWGETVIPFCERNTPKWHEFQPMAAKFFWPIFWKLYDANKVKVIITYRRNLLAQHVSIRLSIKSRVWHVTDAKAARRIRKTGPIKIDPKAAEKQILQASKISQRYMDTFPDAYHVTYEDLIKNKQQEFHKVLDYIGVGRKNFTPATQKAAGPWSTRVSNLNELREYFRGRPKFEQYFEDIP